MRDRLSKMVRSLWINIGVALVVLILLEGAFQVVFLMKDRGRPDPNVVPLGRVLAANPGQPWVREYHRELRSALQYKWHSYVYWRSLPYHSDYLNIDPEGIRRTWNASPSPSPRQPRIFMFGGSTLWGYGARDEFTIPSLVSKKLASQLTPAPWVVNFGEAGYVNTQGLITLMLELRRGNVPDVAVFYDGVNDAWAAFQSGVAGVPQNELNRIIEFNSRDRLNPRGGLLEKLGTYRFIRGVLGSFRSSAGASPSRRFLAPRLASDVVDVYLENVRMANALAREYGFRTVFLWQPTIYSKKVLSPDEQRERLGAARRRGGPAFAEEYRAFNAAFKERMKTGGPQGVFDLSDTFENDPRTIFIDRFHISEVGNEKVAEAITPILREIARSIKK